MGIVDKITHELEDLHADETSPGMAAVALDLAQAMAASDAPTAKAVAARELRSIMADLRKLAPVGEEEDAVNDIARQREKRRADARKAAGG
ncbi:hypothetical protein PV518_48520 [Streptomyces sp. ND04-05B]|uniref:hypothetical protein n=1 Tax=Streptomyces sp. ND04-05B TaxID=3028693 RepID=UPI0029BD5902|nr:hypothetical protein [Streptomyces sp. ND04-05B]MDX3069877.1 hypothetical protein [Streptomyces sp. ND04-05B]